MRLDVTKRETGSLTITERLMEALHGLEHQGGRLDCAVGASNLSGLSLDVELEVDETSIEGGFGVAMTWLRTALEGSQIAESQWYLRRIEIDITPSGTTANSPDYSTPESSWNGLPQTDGSRSLDLTRSEGSVFRKDSTRDGGFPESCHGRYVSVRP